MPTTELDVRYSSEDATATSWEEGRAVLERAELYWLSTVRPDGRPHVTPLVAVWADEALHFCTGPQERKAQNLIANPYCVLTTGTNRNEGIDVVVEGRAEQITDERRLVRLADAFVAKYGEQWRFAVHDGAFAAPEGGVAWVFAVAPKKAFGFGKGDVYSQTRWTFPVP